MKKTLFHVIRYAIILLPILFLIVVLSHTNYYTNHNRNVATNYPIEFYQNQDKLSLNQLQNLIDQKSSKSVANQITIHHEWKNIIHQITTSNSQRTNLILNILPYAPVEIQTKLNHAIAQTLLVKPNIVLQSLALTHSTLQNTDIICKAKDLSTNDKLHLAGILQTSHNPSFIYQQQSCLHTLLETIHHKQAKLS